jgi:acyl CoA:acetate/3-ketoacid CoA transferase alpha subunit
MLQIQGVNQYYGGSHILRDVGLEASAGKITVVEVEELVEIGELDPDQIHTSGIYVHRIVVNATPEKRIEQRKVRA